MKCAICHHGETHPGTATITLERDETTVIIKEVPAEVCENCGEYYLSEQMTEKVMALAEDAVGHGVQFEVLRYEAATAKSA